ncbi:response regulator transcription factor [Actinomycetospora sp. TBRC 11914]|uniref:response regulator transcription factor n=1 Tax=Actinomycetospora sp. TBRC 11914 TaxID=2729387 RepID=UPI00145EDA21|nr:response regulator transcription factor [Actinomycetospora sp. TBRC 11914]NMO92396.1 response regulator transcription factor [Actinomycetospora sp. TBRC 11914]
MTSVLIADDHRLFTELVGAYLAEHGIEIAGVAATGAEALARVRADRPDVCLVHAAALADRGAGPVTAFLAQLAACSPGTRVVVLTEADVPGAQAAIAAGAAGYVRKSASGEDLVDAIERAARGEAAIGVAGRPGVGSAAGADDPVDDPVDDAAEARRRLATLRARERECLALIAGGASTEEMAATMGVTVATVRSHVRAVLAALGVHSRLGAASVALRHGLVGSVPRAS